MAVHPDPVPRGPVRAQLNYYTPPPDGSRPHNYVEPAEGQPQRNFAQQAHAVDIADIRGRESDFQSLDRDAFQVLRGLAPSAERSFADDASIRERYYPEVEELLLSHIPGASRVHLFDHTIRRTDPKSPRAPVTYVHIDQTARSVEQRVRRHMGDEADALLRGRYRIVNVWRPLNKGPVETFPLAFASSASLDDADVVPVEHRYPNGYTGETASIRYNPGQKWYYLSGMTGDERILLECFDSEAFKAGSGVQGGRVPHTAFVDPRSRPDAEGRESIEVRALVFGP
ncbi:uncharacterized protein E0L32_006378 [Thyridium curvatum]|uniref:Methyltransferase n=1 Tax=Thyridium curvatum TaxID=1093900 RepID=A0A507B8S5_9PEZI|nr:uncharacterized protein E0L32_006378 [Thyridium curvatum]TPX13178.1 hypothetical protein E0L32_006378 [Thyridium curvatum]